MVSELHPYIAYAGPDPSEGACLVFAATARAARRLAYPVIRGWGDAEWIDIRAKRLPGDCAHLRQSDEPHVIESPPTCERCELWWAEPLDPTTGLCVECMNDDATWDEVA